MSVVVAAEVKIAEAALIRKVPDNLPQKVSLEDRPQHRVSNQVFKAGLAGLATTGQHHRRARGRDLRERSIKLSGDPLTAAIGVRREGVARPERSSRLANDQAFVRSGRVGAADGCDNVNPASTANDGALVAKRTGHAGIGSRGRTAVQAGRPSSAAFRRPFLRLLVAVFRT